MRLSQFNVYLENEPEEGCTLIHNTFSGAYVVLDDESHQALRRMDCGEPLTEREQALASDPDLRDPDVGIVVPSHEAEWEELEAWFEWRRARAVLEVTVAVNRACNFACSYCCQADVLDGAVMAPQVADQVADWLVSHAIACGLPAIDLTFVGGEPLLHPARIRQIAARVRHGIQKQEMSLSFRVTTNGTFLTPALVAELESLGLDRATVTLDGDETTHSRTRRAKNGEDTFARVFENAVTASQRIRVSINGNYRGDTLPGFAPLLRKLAAAGLPRGSTVSFSPALETLGGPRSGEAGQCAWTGNHVADQVALYDSTLRAGFDAPPLDVVGPCQFHDRHSFAVDVDGSLHACPGLLGHPELALGYARVGARRPTEETVGVARSLTECRGCAHLPSCGGGCVAAALLGGESADADRCARGYLVEVQEAAIRRAIGARAAGLGAADASFRGSIRE